MNVLLVFSLVAIGVTYGAEVSVMADPEWLKFKNVEALPPFVSAAEELKRATLFQQSVKAIKQLNSDPTKTFASAPNRFSIMTEEEKKAYTGAVLPSSLRNGDGNQEFTTALEDRALPATYDLRGNKCLVAVKDQKACGSCWAFAANTPLEFSKCRKTKVAVNLSEEQLVDCDKIDGGCNGGFYTNAWTYQKMAGGAAKTKSYPYTASPAGNCTFNRNKTATIGAKVALWAMVTANNSVAMQTAIQKHGPLAVAINVINSFQTYKSGVYNDPKCDVGSVNHAVVVVGWGAITKPKRVKYWIVRNSWGSKWGAKGYILIERGVNKCQIEKYPAYVVAA